MDQPLSTDDRVTRLTDALTKAKGVIKEQQEEIEKLQAPPNSFGTYIRASGKDTAIISSSGREMRVYVAPDLPGFPPVAGSRVILNETMAVIEVLPPNDFGETAVLDHILEDGRLFVCDDMGTGQVLRVTIGLPGMDDLHEGDTLLIDAKAGLALSVVDGMDETQDLLLEEVPDISYDDIGGLDDQIQEIHDSIELPYLHAGLFAKYHRKAPKGILLYGPPGCGKTLVAKAVANSLAKKAGAEKAFFLNIKGPELLTKWVGETERKIREVFQTAREKANDGFPVIIFFDEMESMFRQRGGGISSDTESTIVPSLLAEMDGVEGLHNVIVIGASNRQDLIDPAILRPGRLDVKIQVGRPDRSAAIDIFDKYLIDGLPYASAHHVHGSMFWMKLGVHAADHMYREDPSTEFLEVTYQNGVKEMLYFKDFASGAMIASIVDRAKTSAIKDEIAGRGSGISLDHLLAAVTEEFKGNEDLPNTSNPDDWAKIAGRKGERIVHVRPVLRKGEEKDIDQVEMTGTYL